MLMIGKHGVLALLTALVLSVSAEARADGMHSPADDLVAVQAGDAAQDVALIEQLRSADVLRALRNERRVERGDTSQDSDDLAPTDNCLEDDSDDDGIPDSWETAHGLDPHNPDDAWLDPDGDSVVNLFEFQLGADPSDAATPPVKKVAASGGDYTDVKKAIDGVSAGTVIRIATGTYAVNYITFKEKRVMLHGGWSSDFAKRDLKRFATTLDGGMTDEILYFSFSSGSPVVILDGLRLTGGDGSFGAVNLLAQGTACVRTAILDCVIEGSSNAGSFGGVVAMHDWGSSSADRTMANTMITGNTASGIYSQNTESSNGRWRILGSTISGNSNGGGRNGEGIDAFTLDSGKLIAHVYNSIIWGNDASTHDLTIHGWNQGVLDVSADHADLGTTEIMGNARLLEGDGMVDTDPLFRDPALGDYHLSRLSPIRDLGIARGLPMTDFEGDRRTRCGAPDPGADETDPPLGDSNGDCAVDFGDIDCFVAALIDESAWRSCVADTSWDFVQVNDINQDGHVDFGDIDGFVECVTNGGCP